MHVADLQVRMRRTIASDRDQALGGVQAGNRCSTSSTQLDRKTGAARHIQDAVARTDSEQLVQGDVLAAIGRFAQRGEVDRSAAPALVHNGPLGRGRVRRS
jgi:hypothetical protein